MKALIKLAVGVAMLVAMVANAQYYPGPYTGQGLASNQIAIAGITTSNLASSLQVSIPVGPNGVGLAFYMYGTNAASTTNATVTLQGTVDGTTWLDTPTTAAAISVLVPQSGTTIYASYTNIAPNTAAAQNVGNLRALRIKSVQNTNLATIWISNVVYSIR